MTTKKGKKVVTPKEVNSEKGKELENIISDEIKKVEPNLSKNKTTKIAHIISKKVVSRVSITRSIGPLPPPEILGGYEKVLSGSAERILKMAENQASHRQNL